MSKIQEFKCYLKAINKRYKTTIEEHYINSRYRNSIYYPIQIRKHIIIGKPHYI